MLAHLPNALSILRGIIALFLPSLIFSPSTGSHVWAAILFTIGAVSDYFDGYVARRYKLVSSFGKFIDPLTDKMLILLPLIAFSRIGFYSYLFILPILIREIFITFARIGWMLEGQVIAAEKGGKWKFGIQTALVGFSLLLLIFRGGPLARLFYPLMLFSLYSTLILTVYSGWELCRHNLNLFKTPAFCRYFLAAGVGLLPKAPGTWGTLVGIFLVWLFHGYSFLYFSVWLLLLFVGWRAALAIDIAPHEDPGYITLDEVCGVMLAFWMIPLSWMSLIAGFLLFRFFDILKPFPLRKLERFPGYWGIMADDLGAGALTWIILAFWLQ